MLEDFFENYFKIEKAYRKYFQDEMEKYHLTPNELLCFFFWHATTADAIRRGILRSTRGCPRDWLPDRWRASWKSSFLWWNGMLPIRESAIYISRSNAVRSQSR